jgi:peroxiredoxin Q/BCP
MKALIGALFGTALALMAGSAFSADLKVGDRAPSFNLPGTDGQNHALSDLAGKTVVLAWFPKAFTGG